jgi:hypothetical protein
MFNLLPEIFWLLLMLGAIVATIVAAVREKKARSAAVQSLQSTSMSDMGGEGDSLGSFGNEEPGQFEFNVDSVK